MSEEPTYEAARAELVEVVRQLETGGAPLAESMALWRRGEALAAICQGHLDAARRLVEESRKAPSTGASASGE